MLPYGPDKRIVVADKIVAGLRAEMRHAKPGETVWCPLPSLEHEVKFSELPRRRISKLLIPDSGSWPVGSKETEQMKALDMLLGYSKTFLDASPLWLSRDFSQDTTDGNQIEIGKGYFFLRLVTGLENSRIGAKLCYDLRVQAKSGRDTAVVVDQSLHSREIGELVPLDDLVGLISEVG